MMDDNDETILSHAEDLKFLSLILRELLIQVDENIEVFSCGKSVRTEEFVHLKGEDIDVEVPSWFGKSTSLEVIWRPGNDKNHAYKHIDKLELEWHPQHGTMVMEFRHQPKTQGTRNSYKITYKVGYDTEFNNEFREIKKNFHTIFKKVDHWRKVEVPRRNREQLINAVCDAFPGILDTLLVGDSSSEKT